MGDERKAITWRELFEKTVDLGLGAALLTKEAAGRLVEDLVKRGSMSKEEGQRFLSEVLEKGKAQKEKMEAFVHQAIERILASADLARQSTVQELERRVTELEEELKRQRAARHPAGESHLPGSDCL